MVCIFGELSDKRCFMESTVKSDFAYIKALDHSPHYAFQSA